MDEREKLIKYACENFTVNQLLGILYKHLEPDDFQGVCSVIASSMPDPRYEVVEVTQCYSDGSCVRIS